MRLTSDGCWQLAAGHGSRIEKEGVELTPLIETVRGVDDNDIEFREDRHQFLFEFILPKPALVEFLPHSSTALLVRKGTHPEKGIFVFYREERADNFHSDFLVLGEGF